MQDKVNFIRITQYVRVQIKAVKPTKEPSQIKAVKPLVRSTILDKISKNQSLTQSMHLLFFHHTLLILIQGIVTVMLLPVMPAGM